MPQITEMRRERKKREWKRIKNRKKE